MGFGNKWTSGGATSMNVINILQEILLEAGWTKTADTGQWDGVTPFTSTSQYVMWEMPTNGGTLDPVVLKIHPNNDTLVTLPSFNLVIGKATDGAGTITGPSWSGNNSNSDLNANVTFTMQYAYDDGGVVIHCARSGYPTNFFILIERKRTLTGTPVNGAIGTMFFQGKGVDNVIPQTTEDVSDDFLGVGVFNTNSFTKSWGTKFVSSPIADNPFAPKSSDGLTAPTQPVMFFGPDGGWYSNMLLAVQPNEGGTAMQAVVNGSPRYYRTVQPIVRMTSDYGTSAYPLGGIMPSGASPLTAFIMPAILSQ